MPAPHTNTDILSRQLNHGVQHEKLKQSIKVVLNVRLILMPNPDTKCKKDFANLVQTILVSKNTPIIKLRSLLMACVDAQSRLTNTDTMQHHPGIQPSADYQLNDLLQHGQIGKIGNLIEKMLNINKNCGLLLEADKL